MILEDFHTHTLFCDGDNSPEDMVLSAIKKGLKKLGFSVHSYVEFDNCCVKKERIEEYKKEIARLREKYKDKIEIFCGVEMDYYSEMNLDGFDYVIGSAHYLKCGEEYLAVDLDAETLKYAADKYFDSDMYALCEEYYRMVADIPNKFKVDIIGHFDLITKFCEKEKLFDTNDERYRSAAKSAAEKLVIYNIPFEINTGAISRGYRTVPYPSFYLARVISTLGGKFVLSSDSHSKDTLCKDFEKWQSEYKKIGAPIITLDI